jgi:hypothetical protein
MMEDYHIILIESNGFSEALTQSVVSSVSDKSFGKKSSASVYNSFFGCDSQKISPPESGRDRDGGGGQDWIYHFSLWG